MANTISPADQYKTLLSKYTEENRALKSQLRLISISRLIVFLIGGFLIYYLLDTNAAVLVSVFILTVAIFLSLVKFHSAKSSKSKHLTQLIKINENELKALENDFSFAENGDEYINSNHSFTFDLDIFGNSSVFQFLNRACTLAGKNILAKWISNPFVERNNILSRQAAIQELKKDINWRQNFIATGNRWKEKSNDKGSITEWANEEAIYYTKTKYKLLVAIVPALTIAIIILASLKVIPSSLVLMAIFTQWAIIGANTRKITRIQEMLGKKVKVFDKYSKLIKQIEETPFEASYLKDLQNGISKNKIKASTSLLRLSKILKAFEFRYNLLVAFFLNSFFLWDLISVMRLEKWKLELKNQLPIWFDTIGSFDALLSLSNFSYNNPEYAFPEIDTKEGSLHAENLGHPLLPSDKRVNNDFSSNGEGKFTIITGANMAGKSTFLRTIGVNMMLSMIGAPVCASKFIISPIGLYTSMRTDDSLQKNESYFYAELKRLKGLVDELKSGNKRFIILDEILKGTNSKDKQEGSKLFMQQLINLKGKGIIATHDLALGDLENKFPDNIRNQCFEIEIDGAKIFFDYKLTGGITKKMNASILMQQMGLV